MSWVRRRGFTLIELLVVVAIMALLISILMPSLKRAREAAMGVQCASLQRQFAAASNLYADDFNNTFVPIQIQTGVGYSDRLLWTQNIAYLQRVGIPIGKTFMLVSSDGHKNEAYNLPVKYLCPMLPATFPGSTVYRENRCYGFNWYNTANNWGYADVTILRSKVKTPGGTLQMTDINDYHTSSPTYANYVRFWDVTGELRKAEGGDDAVVTYRHSEGANVAFFDGHVNWMSKQTVYGSTTTERDRLWKVYP